MKFFVFASIVLGILLSGGVATSERRRIRATEEHTGKHELYLLSIFPYHDTVPSLNPSIADGPELFPATQLAVDHVNNRSDVLRDYHIELIEADGGCNVSSKARISLVSQLFHNDKQIVGIMGPSCSDSAEAVGAIAGRSEIALISVHQGSSPVLADRTTYPYSTGMANSPEYLGEALIELLKRADWFRVAALFNEDMLVDYSLFQLFEREAKTIGIEIVFSAPSSDKSIPHQKLKNSYARVILAFVRPELTAKLLCVAYHNDMIYPTYQWFLGNGCPDEAVSFYYAPDKRMYFCSVRQMQIAREAAIGIELHFDTFADSETETVSGLVEREVLEAYLESWRSYNLNVNITANAIYEYAALAYDAVWSMALALNGSLEVLQEKNLSLSNYTYGQSAVTQIILDQFYRLDFQGISGNVSFNNETGFTYQQVFYAQYKSMQLSRVGSYDKMFGVLPNPDNPPVFIENDFEIVTLKVALGLAVVFLLVMVVTAVLVAFIHILNTVYGDYKTIKASSSRLNHFAYVGCYCTLFALLIYTIVETFSTSPGATTALCNFIPWLTSIGFSLVFGTVIVKTWRLYRIFLSSTKHKRRVRIMNKDSVLAASVVVLVAVDVIFCTVWSAVDPLEYGNETRINVDSAREEVMEFCASDYFTVWLLLLVAYKSMLMMFAVFMSFVTRNIRRKEFKTNNITLLVYLLFLVTGVGMPVYFIMWVLSVNVNISYTVLCIVVTALVYLCWALLFLPPVLPLLKEKVMKTRQGNFATSSI